MEEKTSEKIGIDIGSSTLKIVRKNGDKLSSSDYVTALAGCFDEQNCINETGQKRLFAALSEVFASIKADSRIKIVATAAFRKANNATAICDEIERRFAHKCEILSQEKEAFLSKLAAESYLKTSIKSFVDLGGASTEISHNDELFMFKYGLLSEQNSGSFNEVYQTAKKIFADLHAPNAAYSASKALIYAQTAPLGIKNYEINEYDFAAKEVGKDELKNLAELINSLDEEQKFYLFDARTSSQMPRKSERAAAIISAAAILCAMDFSSYIICPYALKDALVME